MRHHILPLEQGWSLSVSLRLSGRGSSFKEHLRMLLEALWKPTRLFVRFLVALPLQHEQSDFCMSGMHSWISHAFPYDHYGFGSGSFLGSMINTIESESLSKVWDDKNKPGRQPDHSLAVFLALRYYCPQQAFWHWGALGCSSVFSYLPCSLWSYRPYFRASRTFQKNLKQNVQAQWKVPHV